jgi:hypothetical protein
MIDYLSGSVRKVATFFNTNHGRLLSWLQKLQVERLALLGNVHLVLRGYSLQIISPNLRFRHISGKIGACLFAAKSKGVAAL